MNKGLKNIFLSMLFIAASASAQVSDPVLMTVNGKDVKRSEFEYAFNKNNNNLVNGQQTVEEYLPMYVDFKLKVAEAEALGFDTLPSFKEEYKRDRTQMAESYLMAPGFIEKEAYKVYANDSATIGKDGFLKLSHIIFFAKQKDDKAAIDQAKARIDSVYAMLESGKSFEETAAFFGVSARTLEPFEIVRGQAYPEFEAAAYSLADGEYSKPFESPAGFHVVKRISSRPFGSFEEYKPAIINMLEQQNISEAARLAKGKELAALLGGNLTPEAAIAREDSLLEEKYPEFGNLMREYYDGLLFFEVSTSEVWDKAAKDIEGQKKYFKKNRKNYRFETPRYRGAVLIANSQENLDAVKSLLVGKNTDEYKAAIDAGFPKDSMRNIRVEIGVFAVGDNPFVDKFVFSQGEGAKLRKGFTVVETVGTVIEHPEVYTDVKGQVVNDYQKYLEEKWVKTLRKKYKVKINKEVLKTVNNHE